MSPDHIYLKLNRDGIYDKLATFFSSNLPVPRSGERVVIEGRLFTVDRIVYDLSGRPVVKVLLGFDDWPVGALGLPE